MPRLAPVTNATLVVIASPPRSPSSLLTVRVGVPKGKAVTTVRSNAILVSVEVGTGDVDKPAYPEAATSPEYMKQVQPADHAR